MATEDFAPAKVNLTLHVTGRRADGYHLLDSLVVFAGVGDGIAVGPGKGLTVDGPFAAQVPAGANNLVLRAATLMGGASVRLTKNLPVASGVGGGSSDAAAVLRALARMGRPLPDAAQVLSLGADVPVCLAGPQAMRMQGIGEVLTPVKNLPPCWLVLVNPGVPVPTGAVFQALSRRDNPPMPAQLPPLADARALADFLTACRNDLEPPARQLAPTVDDCLRSIAASEGCLLARMSGSGATCFGLYAHQHQAQAAARGLRAAQPEWWIVPAPVLSAG